MCYLKNISHEFKHEIIHLIFCFQCFVHKIRKLMHYVICVFNIIGSKKLSRNYNYLQYKEERRAVARQYLLFIMRIRRGVPLANNIVSVTVNSRRDKYLRTARRRLTASVTNKNRQRSWALYDLQF